MNGLKIVFAVVLAAASGPLLAQAKEIRIAHVYDKTGPLEAYAKQTHAGLMMGLEYATGGRMEVLGRRIVIIEKDSQTKPDAGKAQLAAAYADDKVDLAIGPTSSGVALAMLPVAEEYKKILLVEPAVADAEIVHEEYAPQQTTDFTAPAERLFNALKDRKGRKVIFIIWAGGNPFKIADLNPGRFGIEIASGGNILPALAAYKALPGMEGATYYYYEHPKNKINQWLVAEHQKRYKSPPDFFTAGGMSAGIAVIEALKKAGTTDTEKLISAMEGLSFETPKGRMTFRKEDHQAMQSMFHFKIKVDPNVAWAIPELIREIKPEEMKVPIRVKK
jgi:branched-chain amino acid transport system substrate-binding protein